MLCLVTVSSRLVKYHRESLTDVFMSSVNYCDIDFVCSVQCVKSMLWPVGYITIIICDILLTFVLNMNYILFGKSVVAFLPGSIHFQCVMKQNMFKPIPYTVFSRMNSSPLYYVTTVMMTH